MKRVTGTMISFCAVFLMFGCGMLPDKPVEQDTSSEEVPDYERIPSLVPVVDYTGEEYELRDADPDMEISAEMESEIETAVKDFFRENYKTEVKMNRYFHGDGYVRAVVESIGDPLFYTEVSVGLEKDGDTVTGVTGVGAREGIIEQAIATGLVVVSREEQFEMLDNLLERFVEQHPVQGVRNEVVKNVSGSNYSTPFYFISNSDAEVEEMANVFLADTKIDKDEWRSKYGELEYNQERFLITISLYMTEPDSSPSQEVLDELVALLEGAEGIPRGGYAVIVNDSNIIGKVGDGYKKNSIKEGVLKPIVKE